MMLYALLVMFQSWWKIDIVGGGHFLTSRLEAGADV